VNDDDVVRSALDRVLPERLQRLQRVSGVAAVFGGTTRTSAAGQELVLSRLVGTLGDSLRGLAVPSGRGLGGAVVRRAMPCRVNDYASSTFITHDYDRIVVREERLTSIFAVPVVVRGSVRAVLYGGVRNQQPIGDRAVRNASVIAAQLQQELEVAPASHGGDADRSSESAALAELAAIIRTVRDPVLRERLVRVQRDLGGRPNRQATAATVLAPREVDVLRCVAIGASNIEIAVELGLSPQTVKAYLRSAMRRLQVHNRTAAVHAARVAGAL